MFVNDCGTEIALDVGVDIAEATKLEIHVRKPDGSRATWPAVLDGTTCLKYVTTSDALNLSGEWALSAYVEMHGGCWHGGICTLSVNRVL